MQTDPLFTPLTLPCGVTLRNRLAKSAMSDSLGDGRGNPTQTQIRLYERWAEGGLALSIIGEVQGDPSAAEKPGNLVLGPKSDDALLRALARAGGTNDARLFVQLGHAGAMSHPPIGKPKGPSALDLPGLKCDALSLAEIGALPTQFAQTAKHARALGFGGVQIHAAHGFVLSQFLSPLFNKRTDAYGGSLHNRARLLFDVLDAVRATVGPDFPVAIKLNATDQLVGGFAETEALQVVEALDRSPVDLIDISGGTYFPGARSASDGASAGPYFLEFAKTAKARTAKPIMLTGGFKSAEQAVDAIQGGAADMIGLARAFVIDPALPRTWRKAGAKLAFPRFTHPPEGAVTAWYTQQLTRLGQDQMPDLSADAEAALAAYVARDQGRVATWNAHFGDHS